MELKRIKAVLEALLFASGEPVSAGRLAEAAELPLAEVQKALDALQNEYDRDVHGFYLAQLGEAWQFVTKSVYASPIRRLLEAKRNAPLSQAALEVLAIIAYNQPVSRGFIEQVRGVDSSSTVANLLGKGLIEEAGRLDLPGKPVSFATTPAFLRTFGLSSLKALPPLYDEESPIGRLVAEQEAAEALRAAEASVQGG